MHRFENRTAIVTGAGRGIGAAIAERLASEGARVVIADVDIASAEATAERIGGSAKAFQCDFGDPDQVAALHSSIEREMSIPDILINVAGIVAHKNWDALDFAEWKRVLRVNLDGTFLMCRASSDLMRKRGYGRIVNIGSSSMYLGSPDMSHYIASKGGVWTLTRALATELGKYGITANCISPGLTETEGVRESPHMDAFTEIEARQAMIGHAVPEKITPVVNGGVKPGQRWSAPLRVGSLGSKY